MTTHMIMTAAELDADGWHMPNIDVPHIVWREAGNEGHERALLMATMKIGDMHLCLAAVGVHLEHLDDEGETTHYPVTDLDARELKGCIIAFDDGAERFEAGPMFSALGMSGMPECIEIEGRYYTIVGAPFCELGAAATSTIPA